MRTQTHLNHNGRFCNLFSSVFSSFSFCSLFSSVFSSFNTVSFSGGCPKNSLRRAGMVQTLDMTKRPLIMSNWGRILNTSRHCAKQETPSTISSCQRIYKQKTDIYKAIKINSEPHFLTNTICGQSKLNLTGYALECETF